jgi:ATP phosphoribosyltransferase regulatory subunit
MWTVDKNGKRVADGPEDAGRRDAVLAHLVAAGFARAEPPILQPASVFLDLAGEDIRGRIYLTSDASGAEYCLRPEYTIPVCRQYLAAPDAGRPASYSYLGPVFRFRGGAAAEFHQAGLELFGRADREAADAEVLTLALEAAEQAGGRTLSVRIGDAGLFARLLDTLDLPAVWLRRIRRGHALGEPLATTIAKDSGGASTDHSGVLAALAGADRNGARALVQDLLSIAGISSVGGRSANEIAERFLEQASEQSGVGFSDEKREILERFLAITGDPDACSEKLRHLADSAGLDLSVVLDGFDARLNFLAARGLDISRLVFSAGFARNLDYYTGFVFEAFDPLGDDTRPVVGGGRYDRLMRTLGATDDIPAVGAAIWCDRLFAEKTA